MPNALQELIKTFSGTKDAELPSSQAFPRLDLDQIYRELRLSELGKENGSNNLPLAESDTEDTAEGNILAEIERRTGKAGEEYRTQLGLYESRIRDATNQVRHEAEIDAAGEGVLADFDVQVNRDLDFLHNSRTEVHEREQELAAFRRDNKLDRLPHNIPSWERVTRSLVIIAVLIIESMLNSNFFAKGSEAGLFGGFLQAVVLSILNIGGAVFFALFGVPRIRHIRPTQRTIGLLSLFGYGIWVIGINLIVGHYRDFFTSNSGEGLISVSDLVKRIVSGPLNFAEVQSLILALLGIGFSIVAFIDASGLNDPYPGYRSVGERDTKAKNSYAESKTCCIEKLKKLRDEAISDMLSIIQYVRSAEYERNRALDGYARLCTSYNTYLKYLGESYSRLVRRYREENMKYRTDPAPDFFARRPAVPSFLSEPQQSLPSDLLVKSESKGTERMEFFIKEINQKFRDAVDKYESIESLTNSEERTDEAQP